jgi:tetratricopeptide (TPR) repeat protein
MLISTTITNSRADVIRAALESVAPEVDACMVIDTGATDDTMQIAAEVLGPKLVARRFAWVNDFAAARNFALEQARAWLAPGGVARESDWIISADTDEWLRIPGARDFLARVPAETDVVLIPHASRTFMHTRCIRATASGRWCMPVHEYFTPYTTTVEPPAAWEFECQRRPAENLTAKWEHYRGVLESLVRREPRNQRAWYYLGDTHALLGYKGAAIQAFERCAALPDWPDEAGWACYRIANLQYELGLPELALATATRGAQIAPTMTELHWYAGWVHYQLGHWLQAEWCAAAAVSLGPQPRRRGFSYPEGQDELPRQLLRFARARLAGSPLESAPPVAE